MPTDENEIRSLSVREAAEQLGVSQRLIGKLLRQKILPSFQLGRRRLIRKSALRRLLAEREERAQ